MKVGHQNFFSCSREARPHSWKQTSKRLLILSLLSHSVVQLGAKAAIEDSAQVGDGGFSALSRSLETTHVKSGLPNVESHSRLQKGCAPQTWDIPGCASNTRQLSSCREEETPHEVQHQCTTRRWGHHTTRQGPAAASVRAPSVTCYMSQLLVFLQRFWVCCFFFKWDFCSLLVYCTGRKVKVVFNYFFLFLSWRILAVLMSRRPLSGMFQVNSVMGEIFFRSFF